MKRGMIGAVGIALLSLAIAVPAMAGDSQAQTRVTVARNDPIHGRVLPKSHKDACNDRTVKVMEVAPSSNKPIGKTHTDDSGHYSVAISTHKNSYYAVATRKVLSDGFICRRGQSHQINFQQ
jgi:hypothetical protein